MTNTISLLALQEFIRRVLALNLPDSLWIKAEVAQCNASRGHVYLELIEKSTTSTEILAQASAVIWASTHRRLRQQLGTDLEVLLQVGMEILLQARVDFHERYGLKLVVEGLDPTHTVGQLALQRRRQLETLHQRGWLGKNQQVPAPLVWQRLAVISAPQAAGYLDFCQQLAENPYGYRLPHQLFPAAMQGLQVEKELLQQLALIASRADAFDAVVIIRGGGSKLDLAGFDSLAICEAVANCPLPVLTGIGHEIDETLVDLVAFAALKTPTAVAEWLLQRNAQFEAGLLEKGQQVVDLAQGQLRRAQQVLARQQHQLQLLPQLYLRQQRDYLFLQRQQLPRWARRQVALAQERLEQQQRVLTILSPTATLQRGYALIQQMQRPIGKSAELDPQALLTVRFSDGSIQAQPLPQQS